MKAIRKTPANKKAKPEKPRKAPSSQKILKARKRRPLLKKIIIISSILFVLLLSGAGYWVWKQGYIHQAWRGVENTIEKAVDDVSFAFGIELKHIKMEGHRVITKQQILQATGLDNNKRYSLLGLSGDDIKENMEAIEFIKRVEVQKQFPDTILIRISERAPVAFWQHDGEVRLVDSEGVVLNTPKMKLFAGLPVMVGEDAVFHAKGLFDFLVSEPVLFKQVSAMSLVQDRRWDILLKNGIIVKLPEKAPEKAWATLAQLNQQHQLLDKPIKTIDLRVPDKLYILPITQKPEPQTND